jgi:hypothetical protein
MAKDLSFLKRACALAKARGRIGRHYFEKLAGDKVTRRESRPRDARIGRGAGHGKLARIYVLLGEPEKALDQLEPRTAKTRTPRAVTVH